MKTSMIIVVALFLNTTLLLAEPLSTFVKGINIWLFAVLEGVLFAGYMFNRWLRSLSEAFEIDFDHLEIFVVRSPKN